MRCAIHFACDNSNDDLTQSLALNGLGQGACLDDGERALPLRTRKTWAGGNSAIELGVLGTSAINRCRAAPLAGAYAPIALTSSNVFTSDLASN